MGVNDYMNTRFDIPSVDNVIMGICPTTPSTVGVESGVSKLMWLLNALHFQAGKQARIQKFEPQDQGQSNTNEQT